MSVQCSICTSAFLQSCNVCSTLCGHLFHYSCLLQWLEEHKTCPQCRDDTNESTIIKIYLTIEEVDGLVQLRDENENLEVQLERKIVELARKEEDIKKLHESNTVKVKALEEKQKNSETQLRLLEEIMEFYKKRNERKCYEIEKLMTRVKEAEAAVMHCEGEDCGRDKPLISRYLRLKREHKRLEEETETIRKKYKDEKAKNSTHTRKKKEGGVAAAGNVGNSESTELGQTSDNEWNRVIYSNTGAAEPSSPLICIILDD